MAEKVFRGVDAANTSGEKLSQWVRAVQTWKLGLAFIPNATQALLNVPVHGDFQALWAGYRALASEQGRRIAIESGASIQPVLAEAHQSLGEGRLGRFGERFLTPFQTVEQWQRIVAANAGVDFAGRLYQMAHRKPLSRKARWARRRLKELGGNRWEVIPEQVSDHPRPVRTPTGRDAQRAIERGGRKPLIEPRQAKGSADTAFHARNFLDCVKSRARCNCDILTGHLSTSATLIGNIALRTRGFLEWDAKGERFTNNASANQYLQYKYRAPYKLA